MKKAIFSSLFLYSIISFLFGQSPTWFKENEKFGLRDVKEKIILPPTYDFVDPFSNGFAKVGMNGKFGFVNEKGKEVVALKFQNVSYFSDSKVGVKLCAGIKENGKWGLIDPQGKYLVQPKYDTLCYLHSNNVAAKLSGDWGCITRDGKPIIPFIYENIYASNDPFVVVYKDGKAGFVTSGNKIAIPLEYDDCSRFNDEYAFVMKGNKGGLIDRSNRVVIPLNYDDAYLDGDMFLVFNGDSLGLISKDLNYKTEVVYTSYEKAGDLILMQKNEKWGLFDKTFKKVQECIYDQIYIYNDEFLLYINGELSGLMNRQGKIILPAKYLDVQVLKNYIFVTNFNNKMGVTDLNGNIILPCLYNGIYLRKDGNFDVDDSTGYYQMNIKGQSINELNILKLAGGDRIACQFAHCTEGHFAIRGEKSKKWGLYEWKSKKINEIISAEFDSMSFFVYDLSWALVWKQGKVGLYFGPYSDEVWKPTIPCNYDEIKFATPDAIYTAARKDGMWGIVDWWNGKETTGFIYKTFEEIPFDFNVSSEFYHQ